MLFCCYVTVFFFRLLIVLNTSAEKTTLCVHCPMLIHTYTYCTFIPLCILFMHRACQIVYFTFIIHIINLSVTTILSRLFLLWSDIHEIQWNDDCYLNRDAKFITDQLALQVLQKYKKGHHIMFSVSLGSFKEVKKRPFMLIETHFSIFGTGAVSCSSAFCLFSAS